MPEAKTRRQRGSGSIFKRTTSGPWLAAWYDHDGKRREKSQLDVKRADGKNQKQRQNYSRRVQHLRVAPAEIDARRAVLYPVHVRFCMVAFKLKHVNEPARHDEVKREPAYRRKNGQREGHFFGPKKESTRL